MQKILHKALAYAEKGRLLSHNPSAGVWLPAERKRRALPLTLEQLSRGPHFLSPHDHPCSHEQGGQDLLQGGIKGEGAELQDAILRAQLIDAGDEDLTLH
jgi:hypothetical protein